MFWSRSTTSVFSAPAQQRWWMLALLAGALWGGSSSTHAQSGRPTMPILLVRGGEQGEEAINALGSRLSEVAAHYRKTEDELRGMLRRDKSLRLDPQGRLTYLCEGLVAPVVGGETNLTESSTALVALTDTFLLHSKSNSTRKIFLDFDGHTMSGNAWTANYNGGADIIAPPWDVDGSPTNFNDAERTLIQQVWLRVAEDYAAFDVDVTTEFPGEAALTRTNPGDQSYGVRALISPISSYFGNYGGIAYVGAFDSIGDNNKPALIFPEKLSNSEKYIAEAVSHEVGHTLGLSHDGTTTGDSYYYGQGNWAPIMGVGYNKPIVQWSRGEYANANNTENDLNVIESNGLSYRTDDVGDTMGTATGLSGPSLTNTGILERNTDVDFYSVQSAGGVVSFSVTPWERGANVHFLLTLYDSNGLALTNREVADTSGGVQAVSISRVLPAGAYYVSVAGIGSGNPLTTGYSDYGCLGSYTLTANLPAPAAVVTSPTNLTLTVVGNLVQLSWPADHIGWRLEMQTNVVGAGLSSNWFDVPGAATTNRVLVPRPAGAGSATTNRVLVPRPAGAGSGFFRLAYP